MKIGKVYYINPAFLNMFQAIYQSRMSLNSEIVTTYDTFTEVD
jgi:hypothetical protein